MSPIAALRPRIREAGRIRIGEKVRTKSGKTAPAKLEVFRLTSPDMQAIRSAAEIYGGEPRRWTGAPVGEQWELYTKAKVLSVLIPPTGMAFSQFYELWSGGGCQRRCDGTREVISDSACLCASDPEQRECKPHTRLSVLLVDLEGLGLWRLDTQGWNAAEELAGTVQLIEAAQRGGRLLPAKLGLEQRQAKRVRNGKAETLNFVVPTLDLAVGFLELQAESESSAVGPAQPAIETGSGAFYNAATGEVVEVPAADAAPFGEAMPEEVISAEQLKRLAELFGELAIVEADAQRSMIEQMVERKVPSARALTKAEASRVISVLESEAAFRRDSGPEPTGEGEN